MNFLRYARLPFRVAPLSVPGRASLRARLSWLDHTVNHMQMRSCQGRYILEVFFCRLQASKNSRCCGNIAQEVQVTS